MKELIKHYKKREMAISLLLGKPKIKFNQTTFHKLRVEIKKLNALFDLVNFCSGEFKRRKTFRPFMLIFRQAGKVRELQVEEAMLKKYLSDDVLIGYKKQLKMLQLKERELFFSMLSKKLVAEVKKKALQIVPTLYRINSNKTDNYMKKRIGSIKKLLSQPKVKADQLHKLRKQLKTLDYNRKSISLKKQNVQLFIQPDLPVLLGKWHDCRIIIGHLNKAMKIESVSSRELIQLKKIKTKITTESKTLIAKINRAIAGTKRQMAHIS